MSNTIHDFFQENLNNHIQKYSSGIGLIQIVKIIDSREIDNCKNEYENYQVIANDSKKIYTVNCPKIVFNKTDKYVFISIFASFVSNDKYLKKLTPKLFSHNSRKKVIADGLLIPINFFDELDSEYPYTTNDLKNILKIQYIL